MSSTAPLPSHTVKTQTIVTQTRRDTRWNFVCGIANLPLMPHSTTWQPRFGAFHGSGTRGHS
jgi:hypothetical protein